MSVLRVEVPRKLKPLLAPKRYKGAYGGRGGAKSHFFAEQLLIQGYCKPTRIVCIREIQASIKDSVKQLISDKITKLGLDWFYTVLETEIRGKNGSLIVFKGMQSFNAQNIKSLEGYDIAWIEEAQTLSQNSLDLLRPTIRKDGSELWFSWNPQYKTDPVDVFFRKNPSDECISVHVNYSDNPWFPEVLRRDMEADYRNDEDKAEHVWGGGYGAAEGAILAKLINQAIRTGRVNETCAYDPNGSPIHISSDIGFRDTASWWFWQPVVGGFKIVDYLDGNGMDADDWIEVLKERIGQKKIGKIWLPHDARAKTFQSKHSVVERFISAFGTDKVGIVPQSKKQDQINAARAIIPRCEFNVDLCERGLDGLTEWQYEWNEDNQVFSREPRHDWASHPSDAFCYGAQVMEELVAKVEVKEPMRGIKVGNNDVTLDEMWESAPKRSSRL